MCRLKFIILLINTTIIINYHYVAGEFIPILDQAQIINQTYLPKSNYSFDVDYENNQFVLDGKPFRYVSGSFHYFRTPRAYWRDRLRKIRAAGLNAISTYVEWSLHQPKPNTWQWTGEADIVAFLTMAQEEDLFVLLRPGPYICAERDLGGLPSWLMTLVPDIKMRTNDQRYMRYVEIYFNQLFKKIKHLLRGNGGPIIMVQIENEYGSFHACDLSYRENLRDIILRNIGSNALLYTTDGISEKFLRCGVVSGAYATIDFGTSTNVTSNFELMRKYQPSGPLVNSEFYSGWLTHWEESFQTVQTEIFIKTLKQMLFLNASINIYMFYGGTNFGFTAGANGGDKYWPQITSYDYNAPLTEAGDPTDKYFAIRDTLAQFFLMPNLTLPTVSPKGNYGSIFLEPILRLFDNKARNLFASTTIINSISPLTFEKLQLSHGFIIYETEYNTENKDPSTLKADVADRGLVYVNNYLSGCLSRTLKINNVVLQNPYGKYLKILVENQGHLNYGDIIQDWKGIFNVTINNNQVINWNITGFSMDTMPSFKNLTNIKVDTGNLVNGPIFLRSIFTIKNNPPLDTYLNTAGWGKGIIFINGHNLGRYWPKTGPQITLYVPGVFLNTGENELIVLELEYLADNMKMKFQTTPDFGLTQNIKLDNSYIH
ncbi:beta-galactosidase [Microplitis mediator]|uniref:beta-galactosidase n=1 Tax=Microplitis mediator TaxID=375433 RepID=UPI002554F15C|nr:beta-galactosidase [Microplitis mediator]